ncbi:MAG: hypothetical protein OIF57_13375 [Marinobacterium sp.]|nr:hypothetical protein [Marinobacterium sp.]
MQQLVKFTFQHDFAEDRIRMLAQSETDERMAFWLTRRLTGSLLESSRNWLTQAYANSHNVPVQAQEQMYDMYHDHARSAYEQQQLLQPEQEVQDDTEYSQLLTRVEVRLLGDDALKLVFYHGDQTLAEMPCSVGHFHQFLHILQSKAQSLEWQLSTAAYEGGYALQ